MLIQFDFHVCLFARQPDTIGIEKAIIGLGIVEYDVVFTGKLFATSSTNLVAPNNLIPKILMPEHGIQQAFHPGVCRVVYMQIQTTIGAQYAVHLYQPHCHEAQESAHILPVGVIRRVYDFIHSAPVIKQGIHPIRMNILIP